MILPVLSDPYHHKEYVVEAVTCLSLSHGYIANDIASSEHGLDAIFLQVQQSLATTLT